MKDRPTRVLLARHGQTEWNRERRRQGQLDSPLTPDGHQQAAQLAQLAERHGVDAILSSPLGRARTTAGIIAGRLHLSVQLVDSLREIDHGTFAGLTDVEIETRHPGALKSRAVSKYTWRFPGGESYEDARRRAAAAVDALADRRHTAPLLVTHEMVGRMILGHLRGLEPAEALSETLPHAALIEIRLAARQKTVHVL